MALTLSQLVEAIARYEDRLTGTAHDKAAFTRNIDLLRGRVASVAVAAKALVPEDDLSSDANVAEIQILTALGLAEKRPDGSIYAEPSAVIAKADPDQNRQLALLGFFGKPGDHAGVDYSLFERYYQEAPVGLTEGGQPTEGNWTLKDPTTSPWQAWRAGA